MSLTFREEPFALALAEAERRGLLARHFEEIGGNKALTGAPDPNMAVYGAIDAAGKLRTLTARNERGELVGYYNVILDTMLHYQDVTLALEDLYWLAPEYRRGPAGMRFLLAAEQMIRGCKVDVALIKTKAAHDKGPVLERLGWTLFERTYCKVMR